MASPDAMLLSDVTEIVMGQSPPGDSYNDAGRGLPFFQGKAEFGEVSPTVVKWCTDPKRVACNGDILLSVRAPVGPTNVASTECCIGRGLAAIRANPDKLDPGYLRYFLRHSEPRLAGMGQGSTFSSIGRREIAGLRIPLPKLEEQRRIVDLLARAENIVRMRREAEKKAKEIIPALFLDMFGDPVANPKEWPVKPLAVLVRNLDSARKPVRAADRAQMAGRYPYYGASGVIDHVNGYTHEENALLVAEDGANLLSRSTPIAFQASGRYWVNNHAHVLGDAGVAELTFLECSLNLRDLREYITGSAQPKLTQATLLSIPIAVAPVTAQASFARRLSSMDVVVSDQQKAFGCAEQVFQSLLVGVFSEGVAI